MTDTTRPPEPLGAPSGDEAPPRPYIPKVVDLPGPVSPRRVLERTLAKIDLISEVMVVIKWREGSWDLDWSRLRTSDLALVAAIVQRKVMQELDENAASVRSVYISTAEPLLDEDT